MQDLINTLSVMKLQHIGKRNILTVIILFFAIGFMAIYFSFLFPEKLQFADRVRINLMENTIYALEEIEKAGQRLTLTNFYDRKSSTLTYNELVPYLNNIQSGTIFFISHGKIVSNLIPGNWTHAGFYLGTKKQLQTASGLDIYSWDKIATHFGDAFDYFQIQSYDRSVSTCQLMMNYVFNVNKIPASKMIFGAYPEGHKSLLSDIALAKWKPVQGVKGGIMVYTFNSDLSYSNAVLKALRAAE